MKRFRRVTKSKTVIYLRELSVVVVGVMITLSITQLISYCSTQNELNQTLDLIRTELSENLERVNSAQHKWEREQRVYSLLQKHINSLVLIPNDTIIKYKNVIGDRHSIDTKSDSYEVLKSSLLVNSVGDKDFLRKLADTYESIKVLSMQVAGYSDMKSEALNKMLGTMDANDLELMAHGDAFNFFRLSLENRDFITFLYMGGTIMKSYMFEECKRTISDTLEGMEP